MPEFVLDHGTAEAAAAFAQLDYFTQGYIEAMFFTETGYPENGELERATFAELAAEALEKIKTDCRRFQEANREDLDEAIDNGRINGYDESGAGRDFWFTRNGHGIGFWDRDLGDIGEKLSAACGWRTDFPECYLYRGDDGKLYLY